MSIIEPSSRSARSRIRRARAAARASRRALAQAVAETRERGGFEQMYLWLLAVQVGVLVGGAAVLFMHAIEQLNLLFFRAGQSDLSDSAAALHIFALICIPTLGGLVVGALFAFVDRKPDPMTVADVIEARALRGGEFPVRRGILSTIAAAISLGLGASAGREGPAVVAGATISSLIARGVDLTLFGRRTLLGCAVAAAVSASFNAPIAGALFALEVVLGHYAVRAFAPITIASVIGAVINQEFVEAEFAFKTTVMEHASFAEFPAFLMLGVISAIVAMVFMQSIHIARRSMDRARERLGAPLWAQTGFAGFIIGVMAAAGVPQILSVGYQATNEALNGEFGFWTCIGLVVAKGFASAVTMGGRFAGGVFSPALMLGALTGSAFGQVATDIFPSYAGDVALYALAGMGAVSGAVLGAPISTTLIVFELTGSYAVAIAVMVSTSVATVATQQIFKKSYFLWQLERRGVDLLGEPEHEVAPTLTVRSHMRVRGSENGAPEGAAWELVEQGVFLRPSDDFCVALKHFRGERRLAFVPVLDPTKPPSEDAALMGALFHVDALEAYNRALVQMHQEEHS